MTNRSLSWNQEELVRTIITLTEEDVMNKISADPKSLYSDNFDETNFVWDLVVNKNVRNDPNSLTAILLLLSAKRPNWYHLFLDYCGSQCYRYGYQGKWKFLHKLCSAQHILLQLKIVTETMTPEAFFGNILPKMVLFTKVPSVRFLKQTKPISKKPIRRRGYKDKGSMKFVHEVHSAWSHSGPNPDRPDYRKSYNRNQAILNYLYH